MIDLSTPECRLAGRGAPEGAAKSLALDGPLVLGAALLLGGLALGWALAIPAWAPFAERARATCRLYPESGSTLALGLPMLWLMMSGMLVAPRVLAPGRGPANFVQRRAGRLWRKRRDAVAARLAPGETMSAAFPVGSPDGWAAPRALAACAGVLVLAIPLAILGIPVSLAFDGSWADRALLVIPWVQLGLIVAMPRLVAMPAVERWMVGLLVGAAPLYVMHDMVQGRAPGVGGGGGLMTWLLILAVAPGVIDAPDPALPFLLVTSHGLRRAVLGPAGLDSLSEPFRPGTVERHRGALGDAWTLSGEGLEPQPEHPWGDTADDLVEAAGAAGLRLAARGAGGLRGLDEELAGSGWRPAVPLALALGAMLGFQPLLQLSISLTRDDLAPSLPRIYEDPAVARRLVGDVMTIALQHPGQPGVETMREVVLTALDRFPEAAEAGARIESLVGGYHAPALWRAGACSTAHGYASVEALWGTRLLAGEPRGFEPRGPALKDFRLGFARTVGLLSGGTLYGWKSARTELEAAAAAEPRAPGPRVVLALAPLLARLEDLYGKTPADQPLKDDEAAWLDELERRRASLEKGLAGLAPWAEDPAWRGLAPALAGAARGRMRRRLLGLLLVEFLEGRPLAPWQPALDAAARVRFVDAPGREVHPTGVSDTDLDGLQPACFHPPAGFDELLAWWPELGRGPEAVPARERIPWATLASEPPAALEAMFKAWPELADDLGPMAVRAARAKGLWQ